MYEEDLKKFDDSTLLVLYRRNIDLLEKLNDILFLADIIIEEQEDIEKVLRSRK